ncbi:MAG: type II toxin-antitoxin system HicB family antitoxin [Nostoc sp.]|uniref:type II toxin-antitoxin system HicB family antitoxin n=1 Tax=Nostoc sp. TaxID=1180 RepID=UPI002FEFAF6E
MLPPCLILLECHTQAKSLDELIERIKEAIELCLEVEQENAEALEFIGVQRVSVQV